MEISQLNLPRKGTMQGDGFSFDALHRGGSHTPCRSPFPGGSKTARFGMFAEDNRETANSSVCVG